MLTERHLHYIWSNRLFDRLTIADQSVEVVDTGRLNSHDGPDFEMCRLRMGGMEWIGSVEIHKRSSEWREHRHHLDPLYNTVVLHVVLEDNSPSLDAGGRRVPTALLSISPRILSHLERLELSNQSLRCMPEVSALGAVEILDLALEFLPMRMEQKLQSLRKRSDSDHYNSIFYLTLMRYLGAHQNNAVMEQVAASLPYAYLKKHASDPKAIEAMLIGQAGLLSEAPRDAYEAQLLEEYRFYRQKFDLTPIDKGAFRYLRLRPVSYPPRMLGIVAMILHDEARLMEALTRLDPVEINRCLSVPPDAYWQSHFDFGRELPSPTGGLGRQTLRSLIINAVIPTVYYYAGQTADRRLAQSAIDWLYLLPAERNQYLRLFEQNGITPRHAADTQALLQLYHNYCRPMHCLRCPISARYFQYLRQSD
ncbi:MAG: DUF2851 family protein [Porphyromonas sp.]|nr:DUF2851 family protein [Porphyromonas sp.]